MKEEKANVKVVSLKKHPDYIRGQYSKTYASELETVILDGKNGWPFPPIIVQPIPTDHADRKDGGEYWPLDGMHRTEAALIAKLQTVPAIVMSGITPEEGIALQVKMNNAHGLRLSVSAQTTAIKKLDELGMKGKLIAEKTGLTAASISRILGGTQRKNETDPTPDKPAKKSPVKFDPENWMKGLSRLLKGWEKYGIKIRKAGFPNSCGTSMDFLVEKLLHPEEK